MAGFGRKSGRPDESRIVAELRPLKKEIGGGSPERAHGKDPQSVPAQQVENRGAASADQEDPQIEQQGDLGEGFAQQGPRPAEDLQGAFVAGAGPPGKAGKSRNGKARVTGHGHDPVGRHAGLHAAQRSAAAGAIAMHGKVAEFPRQPAWPPEEAPVQDDSTADAGPDRGEKEIGMLPACSEACFPECRHIRVVFEDHIHADALAEGFSRPLLIQEGEIGRIHDHSGRADSARDSQSHARGIVVPAQILDQSGEGLHQVFVTLGSFNLAAGNHFTPANGSGLDAGSSQIDPDEDLRVHGICAVQ